MMETSATQTPHEQSAILEWGPENEDNSTENDYHFGYMMLESFDEDPYEQLETNDEIILENIEFDEHVNLEFYETMRTPTLQQMASNAVVIELCLWVIKCKNGKRVTYSSYVSDFLPSKSDVEKLLLRHLPVPGLIRELVRSCVKPVMEEIYNWICYHEYLVTKQSDDEVPLEIADLMYCIWLPDGKIDYRRTALNILSNRKMNIFDRFKIMCEYCLEDEVKKLPPGSIPERFVRRITFQRNPLHYYWLCYMNHDLDKLRMRNGRSIEAFLITAAAVRSWSAIEYFWDHMNVDEQISKALVMLKQYSDCYFKKQVFSKMNRFQKYQVLSTIPDDMMMIFWEEKSYELAYLTWIQFGNVITYERYQKLVDDLLYCSLPDPDRDEGIIYLVKMWNHTSDEFKNRAVQSIDEFALSPHIRVHWGEDNRRVLHNLDFLSVVLSCGSVENRKRIILKYGDILMMCSNSSNIDPLIRLCLPDANDLIQFRNSLSRSIQIQYHCFSMLKGIDGGLEALCEFFDDHFHDSDTKMEIIDRTVSHTIENRFYCNIPHDLWDSAFEFIDRYFHTCTSHQKMKYKKRIVWSFVNFHVQCRYHYKELCQFINVITHILDDDLLKRYKNVALKRFQRRCRWVEFDKIKIHQFLLWCLDYDYVEMRRFVKSLSIESIFSCAWNELKPNFIFDEVLSCETVREMFTPIDGILLWYFEKSDKVKEFKLKKVFDYRRNKRSMFVRNNNEFDEIFLKNVLPWFFDGDKEEIQKFKEKYKDDEISKMIDIR